LALRRRLLNGAVAAADTWEAVAADAWGAVEVAKWEAATLAVRLQEAARAAAVRCSRLARVFRAAALVYAAAP
jgi:hypothetical protein